LPSADPDRALREVEDIVGISAEGALKVSAKTGQNVEQILEAIVQRVPPPKGDPQGVLRGLIFDSWYDPFLGATMLVRIVDGELQKRSRVQLFSDKSEWDVTLLGVPQLRVKPVESVSTGEVGVVAASIRDPKAVRIGDTLTNAADPAEVPLPGFKPMQPM